MTHRFPSVLNWTGGLGPTGFWSGLFGLVHDAVTPREAEGGGGSDAAFVAEVNRRQAEQRKTGAFMLTKPEKNSQWASSGGTGSETSKEDGDMNQYNKGNEKEGLFDFTWVTGEVGTEEDHADALVEDERSDREFQEYLDQEAAARLDTHENDLWLADQHQARMEEEHFAEIDADAQDTLDEFFRGNGEDADVPQVYDKYGNEWNGGDEYDEGDDDEGDYYDTGSEAVTEVASETTDEASYQA